MLKSEVLREFGKMDKATLEAILDLVKTEWTDWLALPSKDRARRVRRTAALDQAMDMGILEYGKGAAKRVFPEFVDCSSVVAMAEAMEADRSMLATCLGATGNRKNLPLKSKLDEFMELTPGTANRILTGLEAH